MTTEFSDAQFKAPPVAGVFITRRCNLICGYCAVIKRHIERELTVSEWMQAFAIMDGIGVQKVAILGGEPTVVDGIEDIVRFINTETKLDCSIISNSVASEKRLKALVDAGLKRFSTSIDTLTNDGPDRFVVRKSNASLKVLAQMRDWGVPHLTAYVVLSKLNMPYIPEIVQTLHEEQVWTYLIPYHWGHDEPYWETRAKKPDPRLQVTETESDALQSLTNALIQMKGEGIKIANSEAYLHDLNRYMFRLNWHCQPMTSELRVDADGALMCCNDIRGNVASEFNIFELGNQTRLAEFYVARAKDAAKCNGCLWPSYYHASNVQQMNSVVEGAFTAIQQ